jgi:phage portal protein BeeE
MSQGANSSGVLTTEQKLTPESANRMAQDWREKKGGLQNVGKIVVIEQGLKYQATTLPAQDASSRPRATCRSRKSPDLRAQGPFVDHDLTQLSRADQTARYNNYARGISGGFLTKNKARIDDGKNPKPGGDELQQPPTSRPSAAMRRAAEPMGVDARLRTLRAR